MLFIAEQITVPPDMSINTFLIIPNWGGTIHSAIISIRRNLLIPKTKNTKTMRCGIFCVEHRILQEDFETISGLPCEPLTRFQCSSIEDVLMFELWEMLTKSVRFRKCKRCGRYFIMKATMIQTTVTVWQRAKPELSRDLRRRKTTKRKWRTTPPFRYIKSIINAMPPVCVYARSKSMISKVEISGDDQTGRVYRRKDHTD